MPGNRIRILFYTPSLRLGGTERQLYYLASGLDRKHFEPVVWCPGEWGPVGDWLREAGVVVHMMDLDPLNRASVAALVSWARGLRPRIFQSFGFGRDWYDIVFARLAAIPVCLLRRGNTRYWDPAGEVDIWQHYQNIGADLLIANSRAVAEVCERVEGMPREKIRIILPGVAAAGFRRSGSTSGAVLGNVANLKPIKAQNVLLKAFRRVLDAEPAARLIVCGEGGCRTELEQQRKGLRLAKAVEFIGSRRDVAAVYSGLDIYVHSSKAEGLPNAVLEAMACGLPVVATAAGGTPEAVEQGVTGLLVPPGDAEALAEAILSLVRRPDRARKMGEAGRRRAKSRFSIERMVADYERLYLELSGFTAARMRSATS